jgi:hypothetical protein
LVYPGLSDKPLDLEVPYWAKSPVMDVMLPKWACNAKVGDVEIPSLRMLNED